MEYSEAVLGSWGPPSLAATQVLQEAFLASRVVRFCYTSEDRGVSMRCAEPQYVLLDQQAGRTFRVDRVRQVQVQAETFTTVPAESLSSGLSRWFKSL